MAENVMLNKILKKQKKKKCFCVTKIQNDVLKYPLKVCFISTNFGVNNIYLKKSFTDNYRDLIDVEFF